MELDHRAADAAARLRGEVEADLDLDAAYDRVIAGVGRRRARTAGVRIGCGVLAALVAVGVLVAVDAGGGAPSDEPSARNRIGEPGEDVVLDDGLTERGAAILGGLPEGPLDGKESWRLPVVSDRTDGLAEGDEVTLYGRGFEPGESIGAVHCSSEADVASAGVDACDLGDGFVNTVVGSARYDGSVVITVPIRRFITTPGLGQVDCASAAERCLLAIGAAADYDRSGGTYINFADAPPFPEPTQTVDPGPPYTAGQEVTIQAAGLLPGRQYQVIQCVGGEEHCASLSSGRVSAEGTFGATVTIGGAVDVAGDVRPCGDDCTLAVRGIGLPEQTLAPVLPPIPLGPIDGGGTVTSAPPTTAAPDPGTAVAPTVPDGGATVPGDGPPTTATVPGTVTPGATTTTAPTTTSSSTTSSTAPR